MPYIRPQETVDAALRLFSMGAADQDIVEACGVALTTARRWRNLYHVRGLPRGIRQPFAPCPRCDGGNLDEAAYARLLGWYLGDGHIVRYRREVYLLAVFNDARYARLNEEIATTMAAVKPGGVLRSSRSGGVVKISCYWKHWPCLFPQHGPGLKHTRLIELEQWQRHIVERHPGQFLRGLFHSDGCRVKNWTERTVAGKRKRYTYPRYFFSNQSTDIMQLCQWALSLVDVTWTMPRRNMLSVARKHDVAVLDRHVGPKA